jgi:hypothetical protein
MTVRSRREAIRELLNQKKHRKTGLSVNQVAEILGFPVESTREHLHSMPDVYIFRWAYHVNPDFTIKSCRPFSIHRAVPVPKDCPPPPKKEERLRMKRDERQRDY